MTIDEILNLTLAKYHEALKNGTADAHCWYKFPQFYEEIKDCGVNTAKRYSRNVLCGYNFSKEQFTLVVKLIQAEGLRLNWKNVPSDEEIAKWLAYDPFKTSPFVLKSGEVVQKFIYHNHKAIIVEWVYDYQRKVIDITDELNVRLNARFYREADLSVKEYAKLVMDCEVLDYDRNFHGFCTDIREILQGELPDIMQNDVVKGDFFNLTAFMQNVDTKHRRACETFSKKYLSFCGYKEILPKIGKQNFFVNHKIGKTRHDLREFLKNNACTSL